MLRLWTRVALGSAALAFSLACGGCAMLRQTSSQPLQPMRASAYAPPSLHVAEAPSLSPRMTLRGPEDFLCLDASQISVTFSDDEAVARMDRANARPIVMRRVDENGIATYRGGDLVFFRAGARAVLRDERPSVAVRPGDSLSAISLRAYGDFGHALEIARANQIRDPNLILPGQVLRLPAAERRCRRIWRDRAMAPIPAAARG